MYVCMYVCIHVCMSNHKILYNNIFNFVIPPAPNTSSIAGDMGGGWVGQARLLVHYGRCRKGWRTIGIDARGALIAISAENIILFLKCNTPAKNSLKYHSYFERLIHHYFKIYSSSMSHCEGRSLGIFVDKGQHEMVKVTTSPVIDLAKTGSGDQISVISN